MWRNKLFLGVVCLAIFLVAIPTANAEEVIISEDFELGIPPDWSIDNGVWEICMPEEGDIGPDSPHGGYFCAATVCKGNYPRYTNSRLISPSFWLDTVVGDEELHLRFWHWFSYEGGDYGYVQIQVYDEATGWPITWTDISGAIGYTESAVWSPKSIDISEYAGKKVRIAFYHTDDNDSYQYSGWYIDDIEVIKKVPEFTGDFECGWDDWYVDNGVWEVGTPTSGPGSAYSGIQCAGTVLDGNYPRYTDSRLISPSFWLDTVTGDEELHLRFWHWFSYEGGDYGYVQIQVYDEATGWPITWTDISGAIGYTESAVWSPKSIDISEYAGKKVRIAFYHTDDNDSYQYSGWYIDDIEVIKKVPEFTGDFECGWDDWYVDNGVWEVGTPTSGPGSAYSGIQCAGTVLDGNHPRYTNSRLISPSFWLDTVTGDEELHLRFWHWFSFEGGDYGYVQIQVYDEATGWPITWTDISGAIGYTESAVWSPKSIDISEYAGKKVRIAFYHTDDNDSYQYSGWYIDDIEVIKKVPEFTGDFECGWDDWYVDNGVWEVGTPTSGPGSAYSGIQCAGTVLDGNHPRYTNSRLISPSFWLDTVTGDEELHLRFWHWFSFEGGDYGYVQIQVYDEATGWPTDWTDISGAIGYTESAVWSPKSIDISEYAGKKVRIAFYHTDDNDYYQSSGWYIDHIRITGFSHFCECDLNQDGRCDMQDWLVFGEDWGRTDCGTPPGTGYWPNDCECDLNHDGSCDMLDWLRFGEDWGQTDCLICE